MKAAQINQYGDDSVITINEAEKPKPSESQVLVQVAAASLNPFDATLISGAHKEMIPLKFPFTLGGDIAGTIAEVGPNVSEFSVGDKVYGSAGAVGSASGALAEFAVTNASQITKMPKNLDFEQSASLPLVGISALQALTQHIKLKSGQKIFINGGSGGIGEIAIQVAKNIGAYIATTAGPDSLEHAKELGANEVFDYKSTDFSSVLKDYDAAFDTPGIDDFNRILTILKPGAVAVSMVGQADEVKASEKNIKAINQGTKITTQSLDELTKLVESGAVIPHVGQVFPLDQTRQAFEARESGTISGKIVVTVQ